MAAAPVGISVLVALLAENDLRLVLCQLCNQLPMLRIGESRVGARWRNKRCGIDGLDQQIAAKAAERDQAKATIAKLDDSIPLLQAKADIYDKLRENQLTSQITRLDSERQLSEAKHDRLVIAHQVEGLQARSPASSSSATKPTRSSVVRPSMHWAKLPNTRRSSDKS